MFLSKSELDVANERLSERVASLLEGASELYTDREPVKSESSRDKGLQWLYDSDIIFADRSHHVSNKVITNHTVI